MALVLAGSIRDEYNRSIPYYVDTDDLDDAEYHYYRKAENLIDKVPKARSVVNNILNRRLRAYDIEHSQDYKWLTDDLANLVAESM